MILETPATSAWWLAWGDLQNMYELWVIFSSPLLTLDITTLQLLLNTINISASQSFITTTMFLHWLPYAHSAQWNNISVPSPHEVGVGTNFFIDLVKQSKCSTTSMATPRLTQIQRLRVVRDRWCGWRSWMASILSSHYHSSDYNIINIYTTMVLHHNRYTRGREF